MTAPTNRLDGRTAIVTGGGGGIGTRLSVRLAREGANVVIAQRSEDSATAVVDRIDDLGGDALFVRTDVADAGDVERLVDRTTEHFGGVEIVVNNAVNPHKARAESMERADWAAVLEANLTGPFELARTAYPAMQESGFGRVINIGAIQAHSPLPGAAAYAASKAGLEGLTRSLATEWSDTEGADLTVNTVLVGPIHIDGSGDGPVEAVNEDVPEEMDREAATLVGRWGRPSDVAALTAFLAAPESGFITAATIPCDGGRLVSRKGRVAEQVGLPE